MTRFKLEALFSKNILSIKNAQKGRSCAEVVSLLALYFDYPSSNLSEINLQLIL